MMKHSYDFIHGDASPVKIASFEPGNNPVFDVKLFLKGISPVGGNHPFALERDHQTGRIIAVGKGKDQRHILKDILEFSDMQCDLNGYVFSFYSC